MGKALADYEDVFYSGTISSSMALEVGIALSKSKN